jgi:hypothetical protein
MQSGTAGLTWRAFAQPWGDDPRVCAAAFRELMPVGVGKSSSHHLSQTEIGSDNPCSRQLSGDAPAFPAFFGCLKRRSSVYRPICESLLIRGGCINWTAGGHVMVSKRIGLGKTVASVLVCLLLCGVVAAEFPEFLSLTDNTAKTTLQLAKQISSSYVHSQTQVGMFK